MAGPKPTDVEGLTMCLCLGGVKWGSGEEHEEVGMSTGTARRAWRTQSPHGEGDTELLHGPSPHGARAFGRLSHPRLC